MADGVDVRLVSALAGLEETVRRINRDTIALLQTLRADIDRDLAALPGDADRHAVEAAHAAAERLVRGCGSLANAVSVSVQREADRLHDRIEILDRYGQ